jgi:hypothetical protein
MNYALESRRATGRFAVRQYCRGLTSLKLAAFFLREKSNYQIRPELEWKR